MDPIATVDSSDQQAAPPCRWEDLNPSPYLRKKRLAVRVLGVLLGTVLIPLIGLLALAVRLTSRGPGLYRQLRVGRDGEEFTIYKLRSMREDAEDSCGPVWATESDPRVTPLGWLLRWSHFDELPQIINVIRGEMDFVGPRPERPMFVEDLETKVEGYRERQIAMPGITGIAQINLEPDRPDQDPGCARVKVAADLYYIEKASLWLDIRLITATVLRVLGLRYHRGASLLGVTLPQAVLQAGDLPETPADEATPPETNGADQLAPEDNEPAPSARPGGETLVYESASDTVVDLEEEDACDGVVLACVPNADSHPRSPK